MAGPNTTYAAAGNVLAAGTSIAASGNSSGNIVDFSAGVLGGWVAAYVTGVTAVAATNGLKVEVYAKSDSGAFSTTPMGNTFTIAAVLSSIRSNVFWLPPGAYSIKLTNLDATNGVTAGITSNPVTP